MRKERLSAIISLAIIIVLFFSSVTPLFSVYTALAASSQVWGFTTDDYTYDSSHIEVAQDVGATYARLKDLGSGTYQSVGVGSAYTKRKAITINNTAGGELVNYQIHLTVAYDADMQADFDDLRFTTSDEHTMIDYWLESKTDSVSASVWVEVPTIPAASTATIYMYYGDATAISDSSIDDTFIVADDFNGPTLDAEWTEISTGGASTGTFSNGEWTKACDGECNWWSGDNLDAAAYVDDPGGTWEAITLVTAADISENAQHYGLMLMNDLQNGYVFGQYAPGDSYMLEKTGTNDICHGGDGSSPIYLKIANITGNGALVANDYKFYYSSDAINWTNCGVTETETMAKVGLVVDDWATVTSEASFDFFFLKKYAAIEPTVAWEDKSSTVMVGWSKRQEVTVWNSTGSEITNAQVSLEIVYDSDMQADFDDLRFTTSDGTTPVPYWISTKIDSTSATVWVKVPSISASSFSKLYMYYGNPLATAGSSAVNTMKTSYSSDTGILGEWLFNEGTGTTASDSSSNANHATVQFNDGTSDWAGADSFFESGDAIQLDGSGMDGVVTPIVINTELANDFTLETWANIDELADDYGWFFGESCCGTFLFGRQDYLNQLHVNMDGLTIKANISEFSIGSWHHFVLSNDKSEANAMKIYIDGVLVDTIDAQGLSTSVAAYLVFGRRINSIQVLDGKIDDVRVYTRPMSQAEVQAHYQHRTYISTQPTGMVSGVESTVDRSTISIIPTTGLAYSKLLSFSEILGATNAGSVGYQISNNGTNWYYYNGGSWVAAISDLSDYNVAADLNDHISSFVTDIGIGTFYFKAFLLSNGIQKVELDSVTLGYDAGAPTGLGGFAKSASTSSSATFTWNAVTEPSFNHYEIWYGTDETDVQGRTDTAAEWDNSDDSALATVTTATTRITGLQKGSTYYAKIWAVDDYDQEATVADISFQLYGGDTSLSSTTATPIITSPEQTSYSFVEEASADSGSYTISYNSGDKLNLSWDSSASVHYVNLYYSTDAGAAYTKIAGPITNTDHYTWTVPQDISGNTIQFKIEGTDLAIITTTFQTETFNLNSLQEDTQTDESGAKETSTSNVTVMSTGEQGYSPVTGELEDISEVNAGDYIRSSYFSTVYYLEDQTDGSLKRRPFIDAQTFFTYQDSFKNVKTVTDATLTTIPLGSPMLPNPGVVLIKIQSDPKVYAIDTDGYTIRWIQTEEVANTIYGAGWGQYIIDIEPTFFPRFQRGTDVKDQTDITLPDTSMKRREELR